MPTLRQTLHDIAASPDYSGIADTVRGIEKESLRITPNGTLAMTEHPKALGSALAHPQITTDYSEALLEFITEPNPCMQQALKQLQDLHAYTYHQLDDEQLWITSMPCMLGADDDIPVAQYGSSNSGTMKTVYRLGLGHRYGRAMQTIAGIHYNFSVSDELWEFLRARDKSELSLQDYKTQGYFHLIRNFRRNFWLLLYLFGASPSVCKSFLGDRKHDLEAFGDDHNSLHAPYATSLRMGDLGYQSNAQESLVITYNCLDSYIKTLCCAITQPHEDYSSIGVKDYDQQHQQLSDSLLQIENEFYSVIRPKRTAESGETALSALDNRGVEYIEVRCLDLNPYEPVGINQQQMQFVDTFLLYCLFSDSPASDETEHKHIQENQKRMVYQGRDPKITLFDQGTERPMLEWASDIIDEMKNIAALMDEAELNDERKTDSNQPRYSDSVIAEAAKLADASLTPSARVLREMKEQQITFYRLAMNLSTQHKKQFLAQAVPNSEQHQKMAAESLEKQIEIEQADTISFDQFLEGYFSQYQCAAANAE